MEIGKAVFKATPEEVIKKAFPHEVEGDFPFSRVLRIGDFAVEAKVNEKEKKISVRTAQVYWTKENEELVPKIRQVDHACYTGEDVDKAFAIILSLQAMNKLKQTGDIEKALDGIDEEIKDLI